MQQKIRVMVVDDSLVFRTWLVQSLSADPRFEVVGYAVNALDAKGKLPLLNPDIMTLDIEMPGMNGMETFERMKEFVPEIPVIFLTASGAEEDVVSAIRLGAVNYLKKPFEPQELLKRVAREFEE